uniref:Uncharacterized protein n=1 Tax=Caenorhabditis japonica TaxID=281687 RepID=A0A8R1IS71_CAEJA
MSGSERYTTSRPRTQKTVIRSTFCTWRTDRLRNLCCCCNNRGALVGTLVGCVGSTKLNRPQEELNQGVHIAVCNSLATTPKESAIRKKKDRESRRLRRADSTEKEKMMERISNSQSKLETRLSETQERVEKRRSSLRSNAKAKRASETKEQRTERFTYHSTRYRNKKDEKNATTAKDTFGGGR